MGSPVFGMRFFAGYPIAPATVILSTLFRLLPARALWRQVKSSVCPPCFQGFESARKTSTTSLS